MAAEPPFKVAAFIHPRPGMSFAEFVEYWQGHHADVIVDNLPGLRRYVQNPRTSTSPPDSWPWDGMAELWFDDLQTFKEQMAQRGQTVRDDEDLFISDRPVWFPCRERIVREVSPEQAAQFPALLKAVILVHRASEVPFDEFVSWWSADCPATILAAASEARRYVQSTRTPAGKPAGWPYDGMAELWFEDSSSWQATVDAVAESLRGTGTPLVGTVDWLPVREHPVVGERLSEAALS